MKITYIRHSSFMTEPDHAVLLFDYFEGSILKTDREKPLSVSASHRHGDHFFRSIFDSGKSRGNTTYVLSDDVWTEQVPEDLLGRTIFLGPKEEVSLKNGAGNPVDIRVPKSTGRGVAFLVSLEGRTIYHAGDLNNWVWEGEPKVGNHRISENLHREMNKLTGRYIDVAFVLIDPRQGKDFYLGVDSFARMVGADMVFPMHFWGGFQAAARFKTLACVDGYEGRIQEMHKRGEGFLV